jgi:protocatechuate 3,4-dioxygenase alpha subunit
MPEDRRGTLIAHKQPGNGAATYRFDIRVQGENETIFFDI